MTVETLDTGALKKAESEILSNIPETWTKTTLGECFKWGSGGTPKSGTSEYYGGNIPWLVIGDLNDGIINKSGQTITEQGLENSSAKLVDEGTLLLAMYGSIGKLGIAGMELATNQAIAFAEKNEIETKYIFGFLRYARSQLSELGKGATQQNISQTVIKAFPFPLAPLNEQKRIVKKIEELFSELDNGIASLKTAREQLKVYRQAVLKHAFEGKLTAKWREENADKLESPEQLLARIQQEREARYHQQLEEWEGAVEAWEANGKEGKKPKKPRPLDLSVSDESTPEFQLPNGWIWCKVRNLISDLTDYHANGSYEVLKENVELKDEPDYALMVRATNFEKNNFESDQKYINKAAYEFLSKSKLFGGEILVGKIGNAGKVYLMPYLNRPASLAMNLFCLRFEGLRSTFIYNQLMSARASEQIKSYVKGVGNPTIDKKALRSIDIALPCEAEQEYLIEKIENILSQIERVKTEIQTNLDKSESLRQSILKKAFSGQLVPQNPSDEPASELLARIQAEREATKTKSTKKARKAK